MSSERVNRRRMLKFGVAASGLGAVALLAACAQSTPPSPTVAPTAAPAATSAPAATTAPAATSTAAPLLKALPSGTAAASSPAPTAQAAQATAAAQPTAAARATGAVPGNTGAAPTSAANLTAVKGGTFVVGGAASSGIDTLDPQVSAWNGVSSLGNLIFDPLVYEAPDGSAFLPGLAKSWEVSPDATSYTFHLRNDVKFHDGTPFNAQAVQFNFDRIADPTTKSKLASTLLGPYDKTEIVDDFTVTVHMKEPFAPFLDGASRSNLGIASPTAVKKYGADYGIHPTGTGYFVFKDYTPDSILEMTRNPDYNWGPPTWKVKGPALLDGYTEHNLPEQAAAQAAFNRGEIDSFGMDYKLLPQYANNPKYYLLQHVFGGFPSSYLQNVTRPPTDDINVRKALIYAVDQETVNQIGFHGFNFPAHGVLNPGTLGYDPEVEKMYHYDPEMAKKLLDDAGWKPGPDGIRVKNGQKLSVIFVGSDGWQPYAVPVQPMYKAVGVDMQIQILSAAARQDTNQKGDENLAALGFGNSDPYVLSNIFLSKNIDHGFGWTKFKSTELDNLLNEASGTGDVDKRKQLYSQIQKMIMENALTVPIATSKSVVAYPSYVHDVAMDVRGFTWLHDARIGPKS